VPEYRALEADRAIDLFARLKEARPLYLQPALAHAIAEVGVDVIDNELKAIVSSNALTSLAKLGIRGERVYPTPSILSAKPPLIAYYRMLLGLSQKAFSQTFGYGRFARAERTGTFIESTEEELPELCRVFADALNGLVEGLGTFTDGDLQELTLLTLGSTFQGSRNVQIGQVATQGVFDVIREILEPYITAESETKLAVRNAAGRTVTVTFGADPDVRIDTEVHGTPEAILAMEIKGGSDRSNVHNRAGEAEKSHLKAKVDGYQHRWTIISLTGVKEDVVRQESPSTTLVFDVSQVLAGSGPHFEEFKRQVVHLLGLPENPPRPGTP
jgi:hypothetical protein